MTYMHVIEGEGLQSVSEQVVGVHTDRICPVDIPGLKLDLMVILTICMHALQGQTI